MNKPMTIATRLWVLCGAVVSALVILAGVGLYAANNAVTQLHTVYADRVVPLKQIKTISDMYAVNIVDAAHKFRDGLVSKEATLRAIDDARATIDAEWKAYTSTHLVPEEIALVKSAGPLLAKVDQEVVNFRGMVERGEVEAVRAFAAGPMYPATDPLQEDFAKLVAVQLSVAKDVHDDAQALAETMTYVSLALVLGLAMSAFTLIYLLSRRIGLDLGAEPHEVRAVAERVAQGDLTGAIPLRAGDQYSVMAAMATMQKSLSNVVLDVRSNSDQLVRSAAEIAHGNLDLSQRTEEQASALQTAAASIQQISSSANSNAGAAGQAKELATKASEVAERSASAVANVVSTMQGINESSKRIEDITSVIDGIAFQTNILALNAAVEAARAGEQGRGFAVVAGEVRTLAQRSAEAAREIKVLIGGSVERVAEGSLQVEESGKTIQDAVTTIHQLGTMIKGISDSSQEQDRGVHQVVVAVGQIDQTTQQNAALVEQGAAAAADLHQQAEALVKSVKYFQVAGA